MKRLFFWLLLILMLCSCQRNITSEENCNYVTTDISVVTSSQTTEKIIQSETDLSVNSTGISDEKYYDFLSEVFDFSKFPVFDHRVYFYDLDADGNLEFINLGLDDYGNVYLRLYRLGEELPTYKATFSLYNQGLYSRLPESVFIMPKQARLYFDSAENEYFILFESACSKDTDIVLYSLEKISFYNNDIKQESIVEMKAAPLCQNNTYEIKEMFIYKNLFMHKETYPTGHVKLNELVSFNDELENYLNQYELVNIFDFSEEKAYTDKDEIVKMIKQHSMSIVPPNNKNAPNADAQYYWNGQYYDIEKTTEISFYFGDKYGMPDLSKLEVFPNLYEVRIQSFNTDDVLDLTPLVNCKSLRVLTASGGECSNVSKLEQLEFLWGTFRIQSNDDFMKIKDMKNLKHLSFYAQSNESDYFDFLIGYENKNIEWIDFYGTIEQLEIVKKSLPNLTFIEYFDYDES